MAEATPPQRGPNKRLVIGLGAGCCLVLVAALVLVGLGVRRFKDLTGVADAFVRTTMAHPAQGYTLLHPAKQRSVTQEQFVAEWQAVKAHTGSLKAAKLTGGARPNVKTGVMTLPLELVGEMSSIKIEIDLRPADRPVQVVDYRIVSTP